MAEFKCPSCGKEVSEDAAFCPYCGAKLQAKEPNQPKETEKKEETSPDINSLLPGAVEIRKPSKDDPAYDKVIEEARGAFFAKYKNGRRNSYIAMGIVLALAVASVICITLRAMAAKIVGWCLIGTAVVGMLIYYIVTRNTIPAATKDYIQVVNEQLNMRNFSDARFSEVSTDKNEKVELSEPMSDGIYKGINNIASRNVMNGKFDHRSFMVSDMGLYGGQGRARTSAFVGKYFTLPNDLHVEGRYILCSKGAVPVDLPSDVDDLGVLHEDDKFIIYGKQNNKYTADLGDKFIKAIKAIKIEKHLLGLSVVIWSGHSSAYASFDDQIMTLPYQNEFDKEPNEQYAETLLEVMSALSMLMEKGK